jgi:hypothetical protein
MEDRRKSPRTISRAPGRIVVDGVAHPCIIHDRSTTGARLTKFGDLKLPHYFKLQLKPDDAALVECWLIWADGKQAGVSFTKPA